MRFFKSHLRPLFIYFCFLIFNFWIPSVSWALPSPQGYVNDFASVLSPEMLSALEEESGKFKQVSGIELAVVTVPSLEGMTVEDYAVKLFENWKIGQKGKDNGLLFLIAPTEHKARIEVGYGLEGTLNDAKATRLLRDYFVPYAKEGKFNAAVGKTVVAIYKTFEGEGQPQTRKKKSKQNPFVTFLIVIVLIYLGIRHPWLLLFFLSSSGRSGGGSGGFGGGGGFGGFGGGSSGGGGGSSSW